MPVPWIIGVANHVLHRTRRVPGSRSDFSRNPFRAASHDLTLISYDVAYAAYRAACSHSQVDPLVGTDHNERRGKGALASLDAICDNRRLQGLKKRSFNNNF